MSARNPSKARMPLAKKDKEVRAPAPAVSPDLHPVLSHDVLQDVRLPAEERQDEEESTVYKTLRDAVDVLTR